LPRKLPRALAAGPIDIGRANEMHGLRHEPFGRSWRFVFLPTRCSIREFVALAIGCRTSDMLSGERQLSLPKAIWNNP